ncbi:MAG: exosortase A [Gammaproteobacteria bacterium]
MTDPDSNADWRYASLALAGLLLLMLVFYRVTFANVLAKWNQLQLGEFAHGYLVLAISLYLVFIKRKRLAALRPCEYPLALVAVAASSLLWLLATVVDVQMVQDFALLLLVMFVIWTVTGSSIARELLLPVFFLAFAISIWSPLAPLLQQLTADVVFWLTRAAGVPAMRQDHLIVLPGGSLSIEEACSGLRYLLAALTLGVLYAYLNFQDTWSRILVVVIAAVAAVVSNIVRVFIVVYLAYSSGMQHPWVADHLAFGWWLFGGMLLLLMVIDIALSRRRVPRPDGVPAVVTSEDRQTCSHGGLYRAGVLLLAAVLVVSGPVIASLLERQASTGQAVRVDLPAGVQGWSGPQSTDDSWMPRFHGAVSSKQAYRKEGDTVLLYMGSYATQSQGSELISDLNSLAAPSEWQLVYAHGRLITKGERTLLEQQMRSSTGRQRLVWYWYRVAGVPATSRYMAKLLQVYGLMMGRPEASLLAIATDIEADVQDSRQRLKDFMLSQEQFLFSHGSTRKYTEE